MTAATFDEPKGPGPGLGRISRWSGRITRAAAFLWKALVGTLLCLSPVTALIAAGWLMRVMQRETLLAWIRASGASRRDALRAIGEIDSRLTGLEAWPNWILHPAPRRTIAAAWAEAGGLRGKAGAVLTGLSGSLRDNIWRGLEATLTVAVLTLPYAGLWIFAWWGGWENSFNKGYEQFAVGPTVALSGVGLFLLTMSYLPLALARQAMAGTWRAFFDFSAVRRVIRQRPLSCLVLALCYGIAGLPLFAVKGLPVFAEEIVPGFADLTAGDMKQFAERVVLLATAYLFLALLFLRRYAARIYAMGLIQALRSGQLAEGDLRPLERSVLDRLDLLHRDSAPPRAALTRVLLWTGGRIGRIAVAVATLAAWFALAAQVFLGQFLNHAWEHWLLHPFIQLPWYRTIALG